MRTASKDLAQHHALMQASRGFGLIEVLVSLGLLAVILTVTQQSVSHLALHFNRHQQIHQHLVELPLLAAAARGSLARSTAPQLSSELFSLDGKRWDATCENINPASSISNGAGTNALWRCRLTSPDNPQLYQPVELVTQSPAAVR